MPPCCAYIKHPYVGAVKPRGEPCRKGCSPGTAGGRRAQKYRTFVKKNAAYVLQNPTHSLGPALASYLTVCSEIANIFNYFYIQCSHVVLILNAPI